MPWPISTAMADLATDVPISELAISLNQDQGELQSPWDRSKRVEPEETSKTTDPQKDQGEDGKESGLQVKGVNVPSERPTCLRPRWVNFVLKNEVTTIKEILAVVWAQGHCQSFARINMGMSIHRLALMVSSAPPERREKLRKELMGHPAFEYLLSLITERAREMTPWSVSIVIWALGKLYYTPADRKLLDNLVKRSVMHLNNDINLSNTLWGLSVLGHNPSPKAMAAYEAAALKLMQASLAAPEGQELVQKPSSQSEGNSNDRENRPVVLGPQSFSVTILAFAKLGHRVSEQTAEVALLYIQRFLGDLSQQGLVNLVLCTRKSAPGITLSDHLWEEVQQRLEGLVENMSTQDITMCLTSFALHGYVPKQSVIDKLLLQLRDRVDTLTNADLVAALSATASVQTPLDTQLAPRLRELIVKKSTEGQMDSEALTMVLMALAKTDGSFTTGAEPEGESSLRPLDFQLLKCVCNELMVNVKKGTVSAASVVGCLWSLARMHYFPSFKFMDAFSREVLGIVRAEGLADHQIAILMWSLSELRWYDNRILDAVSDKMLERAERGERLLSDLRQYGQMLVPYGIFGQKTPLAEPIAEELLVAGEKYLQSSTGLEDEQFKLQVSLLNVMWAMALLDQLQTPTGARLSKVTQKMFLVRGSTPLLCSQLYHTHLMAQNHGMPLDWVSTELRDRCRQSWQHTSMTGIVSEFQEEVFQYMQQLKPEVEMEHSTEDRLFSVDMGFTDATGQRVAVEADGPMHYTSGYSYIPLKMFEIRNNILRKAGYTVVNVEFYAWRKEPDKLSFLTELLQGSGVVL